MNIFQKIKRYYAKRSSQTYIYVAKVLRLEKTHLLETPSLSLWTCRGQHQSQLETM